MSALTSPRRTNRRPPSLMLWSLPVRAHVPIVDGRTVLGRWQKIFFCELDRARPRKVFVQVTGD